MMMGRVSSAGEGKELKDRCNHHLSFLSPCDLKYYLHHSKLFYDFYESTMYLVHIADDGRYCLQCARLFLVLSKVKTSRPHCPSS